MVKSAPLVIDLTEYLVYPFLLSISSPIAATTSNYTFIHYCYTVQTRYLAGLLCFKLSFFAFSASLSRFFCASLSRFLRVSNFLRTSPGNFK